MPLEASQTWEQSLAFILCIALVTLICCMALIELLILSESLFPYLINGTYNWYFLGFLYSLNETMYADCLLEHWH
jgi:hypothetical protein